MSKHSSTSSTSDPKTSKDLSNPERQSSATPITERKQDHEEKHKDPKPRPEADPDNEQTKAQIDEEIPSFAGHVDDETNAQKIQQRKQADYNALNNIPTAEDDDVRTHVDRCNEEEGK